ncbi:MAG: response regulator [Ruminococcus sp.]|jgi:CheY-like chemotaxis protein/nitrogen-specific signal transduction histidine kinase/HPt (histidine-containing phosphotransfer) domain-containing protein|nr:response regulator [Ruminococcus sp.]
MSSEYKIANHVGRFGVMLYGILRYLEGIITGQNIEYGESLIVLCTITTAILIITQTRLKSSRYVPIVTGIVIMGVFLGGAIYFHDFEYYYISMLCTVGIVCIYLNFKSVVTFFIITIVVNFPLYFTVLRIPGVADMREMLIDGLLFLYGFIFMMILSYRLSVRNTAAQKGLDALASLLQSTPNMMLIVDDMRRISYISEKMAEFADCPSRYAVGRPALDLFRDFEIKIMFAHIIENEGFFEGIEKIDVNGVPHYFKIVCDKLEGETSGMFIDVTEVSAMVEAKIEAEREKENAVRANISKSKFLATMSHEIRTPMNAIIGISQMQMGRNDLPNDTVEAITKIYSSGHGLLGIINDILDLSKIETGKLEILPAKYDLPSLINDTIQLNITRIGSKPIEFFLKISEDTPAKLFGDELRIKQILGNILTNAFKYTDRGSVKMDVSSEKTATGVNLIISISDTGQGMKPEDAAVLGNEFARFNLETNRTTEGTGLGMSITKRLLVLMNGTMTIESEYGVGSTFTVSVPQKVSADKIIGAELAANLSNFSYSRDKQTAKMQVIREYMPYGKVLVVDDVETNLYVAEGLIRPYGITVETVTSGFAAIDLVNSGKTYDIIFMDHMMPQMDGIETVEKLRAGGYKLPIVALTANALTGNEAMFREKGFDDFISKPIDIRRLNTSLNRFVRNEKKAAEFNTAKNLPLPEPANDGISPKLIEVFLRDAKKAIPILSELWKNELFVTTAHAMKSALANVGNNELSELARLLETAGREENHDYIEKNTPNFIEKLTAFTEKITPQKKNETQTEDTEFLHKTLFEIAAACDNYDTDTADKLIAALREKDWLEQTEEVITEIAAQILHAEFEEAAKLCRTLS